MTDFRTDLEILINEGCIAPKGKSLRFVFNHADRLTGSLENLGLSERAYNCLRRSNIDDIEGVSEKWDTLGRMKNCGAKTVKEIKNKYLAFYYDMLNEEERKQFWRDSIAATIEM